MTDTTMSYEKIVNSDPFELNTWLLQSFQCNVPISIDSIEALIKANEMLGGLTNQYSYLMSILSFLKIEVKMEKRKCKNSETTEDMMLRRDCFQDTVDIVKQQYNAISRMITVKQEINQELKMTGGL